MTDEKEHVRQVVEDLIANGSSYNVEALDKIYHAKLRIVKIDENGEVTAVNRNENVAFFQHKRDSNAPSWSTDAEFNFVDADASLDHVIVAPRMQLDERPEQSVFSILLTNESGSWQVIHETAFVQPFE